MNKPTPRELTLRSIVLGILLTLVLAMSNAYLALKLGILTSASIPAAILSMGILRFFKNPSILENNGVQTAASAGEAIAGGIVYTIPALILIGYWHHFDYWTNFLIAASGGILGVLFSIPLRRILVHDANLRFPEGRAIAEVLKTSHADEKTSIKPIVYGGLIGSLLELSQTGFKVLASQFSHWVVVKRTIFGFGFGFSSTMIGAGYLIGRDMAISIFIGAILAWIIILPGVGFIHPELVVNQDANTALMLVWENHMRYLGIGAMLFAGIWTFMKLVKPLSQSMVQSFKRTSTQQVRTTRTEYDIPMPYLLIGAICIAVGLFFFFKSIFPLHAIGLDGTYSPALLLVAVLYVLVIGFLFAVMTAYFSGMVGVTASPGSAFMIASILFIAWLLLTAIHLFSSVPLEDQSLQTAEAITIIIGSIVLGTAAISNDNIQDLKVGQLVGATPWKQELMLLLGVVVSALIIPPVMQLLFDVYGIAGVMPHEGMDKAHSLPAPTAAILAAITEAMFRNTLPWSMMLFGALVITLLLVMIRAFRLDHVMRLSILGVAIGMYLPLSSSGPLFLGGMLAYIAERRLKRFNLSTTKARQYKQVGTLIACGLVAGSALMDVAVAVPFSLLHSSDALRIVPISFESYSVGLSILVTIMLGYWVIQRVTQPKG